MEDITECFVDYLTAFWYFSLHLLSWKVFELCKQNDFKKLVHDKGNWIK